MAFNLEAVIRLRDQFSDKIRKATNETRNFERAANSSSAAVDRVATSNTRTGAAFTRMGESANRAFGGIKSGASSTLGMITGLGTAIVAAGAAFAAYKVGESALKLSSDAEQAGIAFETMLGSADKAQKFLADLNDFAARTPFESPELRDASKRLLAFGFSAEQVIPMLTGVGNAASGLGVGKEGISEITLALGQMRAKAKVSGDEMMQLTEAGIPAWQILADKMRISTGEVMKLSEKGVIPADKAIKALIDGMNKRFPDMMDKQSKTLQGLWSTMKDTFNNKLLVQFGNGIASALKPRFDQVVKWIDANGSAIDQWGKRIANAAATAADGIISRFEGAYRYVSDRYINNPKFQNLNASGKVSFVISDVLALFNEWLGSEGGAQVKSISETLTSSLAAGIDAASGPITKAALGLGGSIGSGIWDGLQEEISKHPYLTMLLTGAAGANVGGRIGGLYGAGIGFITGAIGGGAAAVYSNKDKPAEKSIVTPDGSHAGSLDRVPYNGYIAELHKDEKILSKSEADATRNGSGTNAGCVYVTGNTFNVRQDSDIDAIARSIARELGTVTP